MADAERSGAEGFSQEEWVLWRSLGRLVHVLPRVVDEDLMRACGLSGTEYAVLANLGMASGRGLRMAELAAATALSASRITRVVDGLRSRGLVRKDRHAADARGAVAALTEEGLDRLRAAAPHHAASARRRVLDHVPPGSVAELGEVLRRVAAANAPAPPRPRDDGAEPGQPRSGGEDSSVPPQTSP